MHWRTAQSARHGVHGTACMARRAWTEWTDRPSASPSSEYSWAVSRQNRGITAVGRSHEAAGRCKGRGRGGGEGSGSGEQGHHMGPARTCQRTAQRCLELRHRPAVLGRGGRAASQSAVCPEEQRMPSRGLSMCIVCHAYHQAVPTPIGTRCLVEGGMQQIHGNICLARRAEGGGAPQF